MKITILYFVISIALFSACEVETLETANDKAQFLIDHAIEYHGGMAYQNMEVEYEFRDKKYSIHNNTSEYIYTRSYEKDKQQIKDTLSNDNFSRTIDGKKLSLPDSLSTRYANSINSVNYFAQLPYHLNDPAVNKTYEGKAMIKDKKYQVVKVTFDKEDGGDDFDDTYYYWLDAENYNLDYLAYSFHVNKGGVRFRSAYNQRMINGILFQDYINYKAPKTTALASLPELLEAGKLEELSRIELENVKMINDPKK